MENKSSKSIQVLLCIIAIVLVVIAVLLVRKNNNSSQTKILNDAQTDVTSKSENMDTIISSKPSPSSVPTTLPVNESTYLYRKHGFEITLPKNFNISYSGEPGNLNILNLPNNGSLIYYKDASTREKELKNSDIKLYDFIGEEKIGETIFQHYQLINTKENIFWYKKGAVGYEIIADKELIETFKFIGWN
jgi:hypothetical protein